MQSKQDFPAHLTKPAFYGHQEGERILYSASPHGFYMFSRFIWILVLCTAIIWSGLLLFSVLEQKYGIEEPAFFMWRLAVTSAAVGIILCWWSWYAWRKTKLIVTDRRVVRIDASVPFIERMRILFWQDIAKTKSYSPTWLHRLFKVGTLQVQPTITPLEDLRIANMYYFNDLANYMDKIMYTAKTKPAELEALRPFILKPKGQRYPLDES